jgi:YD repeat-containing protein
VQAPPAQPSIVRSKRKPLESRGGKRVGDPGTTGGKIGSIRAQDTSPIMEGSKGSQTSKSHHAREALRTRRLLTRTMSPLGDDQFIQNFFYWTFLHYPDSTELAYWSDILRMAYPEGQTAMIIASRELGMTLFESADYAARNRSNHDYVYDLYKTYLMRDPDQGGWDFWTAAVANAGRENVRHAFEECGEFSNLVATVTPNGSASGNASSLSTARVDPNNQTGNQLLARDCEWGVGLLNLPGRAGLDLGLGLSYSSLVWTRSGPYLYFDEDNGSPSPGFRLGFATIQWPYFDARVGRNVYMLITSGGHRVELRQVGTSNVYEAGDSSYLQLTVNGSSLLLRATDGTQMTYGRFENEWRATQIKDRNGNYLTINYNGHANITNITDTLGRLITFSYDSNANPLSITQTWNGATHTWATFGWSTLTMSLGFSGASVVGTYPGEAMPVLTQVGLDDGSYFTLQYTGAGQVNLIRRYTSDNVQRSYTAYDYASATSDCPRIFQTRVSAENWTGVYGVPSEVVTQYSGEASDTWRQLTAPDGTVFKEFYGTGWQRGLTTQSEVWSSGVRQKWTTTAWTQDNTGVSYQTNPRVTETNIYDAAGNRRRTTINYQGSFGLPWSVAEYAADGVTTIRSTYFEFNNDATYIDRRIIGLLFRQSVYDGSGNLNAKTEYYYDWINEHMQNLPAAPTQHDAAYGAGFIAGRGNLCDVIRYDATDQYNWNKVSEFKYGYDIAGSVAFTRDHLWHQNFISYTDSFSDSVNRNTFAYPTTITDGDWNNSYVQYNYDFGARTRVQGPPPAGQSQGAIQTFTYDSAQRIQQVTTTNSGAYTRYVYGSYYIQSWSSVNNVADDSYSIQTFDGAGRVIGAAAYHPGSASGYKAQLTQYDLMGRVMKQSNPAEVNGSWVPAGDDAAGFLYTQQTYDWKGRPLVTTNQDGTQKYASYSACGCAGSEVATLTDEMGRQQKVYNDVLGRTAKVEVLNWNGSVYATTSNSYNARDQVTLVRQYQGADTSGTYQDTTMTYDGFGRLKTKHVPEQNVGTGTVYNYNPDDTLLSVTDARGASTTYGYNARHLVTGITYSAPSGIPATPNVSFAYDAAGNRTSMTDGMGSKSYSYNQVSQMTSETRTFTGLSGSFTLNYAYNLAGELTSITDPFSAQVGYNYDTTGRLSSVTGSGFAGISTYASNIQYRAFDTVKSMTYGNSKTLAVGYNSRLAVSTYEVPGILKKSYQRNNDSSLQFTQDQLISNSKFDRKYTYDHLGRVSIALSGAEARGGSATDDRPYNETFTYDAMDHLTTRPARQWDRDAGTGPDTFVNNRNSSWNYDAAGRLTSGSTGAYTYDAAGRVATFGDGDYKTDQQFDSDGQRAKSVQLRYDENTNQWVTDLVGYNVTSSVLGGQVLTTLTQQGTKDRTFVYAGGSVLAWQSVQGGGQYVGWEHHDASGASFRMTDASGQLSGQPAELDPVGANAGLYKPFIWPPADSTGRLVPFRGFGDMDMAGSGCVLDGMPVPCGMVTEGNSVACPNNECSRYNPNLRNGRGGMEDFHAFADGYIGYFPSDGNYLGNGLVFSPFAGRGSEDELASVVSLQRNHASALPQKSSKDDCHRFADIVEQIAKETLGTRPDTPGLDVQIFMDQLATTFTEFTAARLGAVTGAPGEGVNRDYRTFGSGGFAKQFFEKGGNQVRHAVGGLIAGYVGIPLHVPGYQRTGIQGMNDREDPNDLIHGVPDINLNSNTVPYGMSIATFSKGPSLIGPGHIGGAEAIERLPNWIRNTLCAP